MRKRILKFVHSLIALAVMLTALETSFIPVKSYTPQQSGIQVKLQIGSSTMYINEYAINLIVAPELNNSFTYIPITVIPYGFGIEVQYLSQTEGIIISADNIQVGLQIGLDTATLNGNIVEIPPIYLKSGIPMLPLKVFTDGLNILMDWNPVTKTITMQKEIGDFNPNQKWLTVFYPEHGTMEPSGIIKINTQNPTSVQIYPDELYTIKDVLVDGISVGAASSYTFSDVSQGHTIQAIFIGDTFILDASAGVGGVIYPSGRITATANEDKTFIITPNINYIIKDVLVDGTSVGPMPSYTFRNISSNHTINAMFEKELAAVHITLTVGRKTATVNGEQFSIAVAPIIKEGRTFVPLRFVSEQMGCIVDWQDTNKKITITNEINKIELWIGKSTAVVNGKSTLIDSTNSKVVPIINSGTTLVPIRFVSESLGYYVDYNSSKKLITISNTPIVTLNKGVGYTEKSITYNNKLYNFKIVKVDPKINSIKIVPSLSRDGYNKGSDYKTFLTNDTIMMVNGIPFDTTTFNAGGTLFGNFNGLIEEGFRETFIVDPYGDCYYEEGKIEVSAYITSVKETNEKLTTYSINSTSRGGFTFYTNWYKDAVYVSYDEVFVVVSKSGQVINRLSESVIVPSSVLGKDQYGIYAYQHSTNNWTKDTIDIFNNATTVNLGISINGRDITNSFFVQSAPLVINNGAAFDGATRYPDSFRMTKNGARVFIGTDGRYVYFIITPTAMSLREDPVGKIILKLGYFKYVLSLDGGGSTLLYYNGKYIYTPGRKLITCIAVVSNP